MTGVVLSMEIVELGVMELPPEARGLVPGGVSRAPMKVPVPEVLTARFSSMAM